ncbi:MAG: head maturation protease, ClpP-related, partial [Dokdonella sp.]
MKPIPFLPKAVREVLARNSKQPPSNASPKAKGSMRVLANGATATLQIYGDIGEDYWADESITAKGVVDALASFGGTAIDVRVNSFGGAVHDGIAIHNELRRQAAKGVAINVFVDGLACSIASLIACAGDTVTMPSNTMMMLHAPFGLLYIEGNAKDVRENAEDFAAALDTFGRAMSASYARKTGKNSTEFDAMWATGKDYWFTAQEAADFGLCDFVNDGEAADPSKTVLDATEGGFDANFAPVAIQPQVADAYVAGVARAKAKQTTPLAFASANQPSNPPGVSTGESDMSEAEIKAKADLEAKAMRAKHQQEFLAAVRERNVDIRAMAEPHCGNGEVRALVDKVVADADLEVTAAVVGQQILAILAKGRESLAPRAEMIADERDNRIKGMSEALDARVGRIKSSETQGNHFRGMSLKEMAKECAAAAGVSTRGMQPEEYIKAAITHTSSDFPQLIGNSVSKAVLRGYNETPEVFPEFTRPISVPDFKKTSLAGLGNYVGITEIVEGAEYKYGTFASMGQEVKLKKRGGMFSITDEAIINDDLTLFDQVPAKMGAAAKRSLG